MLVVPAFVLCTTCQTLCVSLECPLFLGPQGLKATVFSPPVLSSHSQIPCRFFIRGNGRCPFKSDCIYLHQLPEKAGSSDPPCPEAAQLASGSEAVTAGRREWGRLLVMVITNVCDKCKPCVMSVMSREPA